MTATPETLVKESIIKALKKFKTVFLFSNPSGTAFMGAPKQTGIPGAVVLHHCRRVMFGLCKGSSDFIGWRKVVITQAMVGKTVAQFVAVEVKTDKGRLTPEQTQFIDLVNANGGIAVVARSDKDAVEALT